MATQQDYNKNIFFSIIACFLLIFIQGCDGGGTTMEIDDVDVLNAAIKKDPTLLNNKRITDTTLYKVVDRSHPESGHGLVLENMVIRNFIMSNVTLYNVQFKNVTFVDCAFIKTYMKDGTFQNVRFIRGNMFTYDEPDTYPQPHTHFEDIKIDRVLFDGVKIGKNVYIHLYGGVVIMRNVVVDTSKKRDSVVFECPNIRIRIDHCTIDETGLLIGGDKSSAYITNSTFNNSTIQMKGTVAWIENCTITNTIDTPSSKTVVFKNNRLTDVGIGSTYDDGKAFLVDNSYIYEKKGDDVGVSSRVYIYNAKIPELGIGSGSVNVYDTIIGKLKLNNLAEDKRHAAQYPGESRGAHALDAISELNLSNVTIKQGDWEGAELQQGKWNNVQLGPVNLEGAKIGVIDGYRVGYFGSSLKFRESPQPLQIDKPPVPTLEELGLAQFWKENDFPVEQY